MNLKDKLISAWRWLTTTRYTRELERELADLEAENDRLRRESRALMNSLLGQAGVAPIEYTERRLEPITRLRRRSWQQFQRVREAQLARASRPGEQQSKGD